MNLSDKLLFRIVGAVSVVVLLVVIVLRFMPAPETVPSFVYSLPAFNATVNGLCTILLLISLYYIKQKNIEAHKKVNLAAFGLSSLFLVSYIIYHFSTSATSYGGEGWIRTVYFFILITHIILAAAVLPLILVSFYWGLKMEVAKHKKLTRWTYPIWLYVTITGVVVYLMISPYYQH